MRVREWTTTEIRAAAAMWSKGASITGIAEALERSRESVKHIIERDRAVFPRRRRPRQTAGKLKHLKFEVSEYLHRRIIKAAKRDNRSMTSHVHDVLAKHYMRGP